MCSTEDVVRSFNSMINARDLDGLAALLTADHTFVDTAGHTITGRAACVDAWRGFFAAFPSYRNEFTSMRVTGAVAAVAGRSRCTEHADLDGPALWSAVVEDGLVRAWRVYDDTSDNRRTLDLG